MKPFKYFFLIIVFFYHVKLYAQPVESLFYNGEVGIGFGQVYYFGDLNPNYNLNDGGLSIGAFYRINISKHFGFKFSLNYNHLKYNDQLNKNFSDIYFRNLNFENQVFELAAHTEVNFFEYHPGNRLYNFTPYLGLGVGVITYHPFTYDNESKVFLSNLQTEGVTYSQFAISAPITFGVKYNLIEKLNLFAEVTYRFAFTDYLDDVSQKYLGLSAFPANSQAARLQDRSFGQSYGVANKLRGTGNNNDAFLSFKFGVSLNLIKSCCPRVNHIRY